MSIVHMLQAVPQGNAVKGCVLFYSYEAGFDCQSGFTSQVRIHLRTKNLPSGITSAQQEGAIATTDIQNTSSLPRSGNFAEHPSARVAAKCLPLLGGKNWRVQVQGYRTTSS